MVHPSIINSTELLNVLEPVSEHYNLIYKVNGHNLFKIEKSITIKSYLTNKNVVFVLEVPLTDKNTHVYYKVIPIPIHNTDSKETVIIVPKYPFLMVNRMKYRPVTNKCEEVEEQIYLCDDANLAQYLVETCIEQIMLMKEDLSQCQQKLIKIESLRVQPIMQNCWLLYAEKNIIITEICNNEIQKFDVQGTYYLSSDPHCTIQVADNIIKATSNSTAFMFNLPRVDVPELRQRTIRKDDNTVTDLRGVDLGEIKDIINSVNNYRESSNFSSEINLRISVRIIDSINLLFF